jgi:hypothetical protein
MNRVLHLSVLSALAAIATPGFAASQVDFTPSRSPVSDVEMEEPFSSAVFTSGTKKIPLQYHALFRSGDEVGGTPAGLIVDKDGKAVEISGQDKKGNTALGPFDSWSPDANSLMVVPGAKSKSKGSNRLFLVTHFEYHTEAPSVGNNP